MTNSEDESDAKVTHTVFAGNFYFDPTNIIINQGEEVRWINDGGLHDVDGELNSLTSEPFNNPETFNSPSTSVVGAEIYKHLFEVPGIYNYDCSVGGHANNGMIGTITVTIQD
ncbi:MAG: hypothetical protein CBD51_002440 [Flavobacteriales bacterium TMED191]|nr:MAG: hypothetical protein CBD51_002440 [Flavobacteriales bacterium TMED191]